MNNQGWTQSQTGGTTISAPEAAKLLGVSHNYFLEIFLKMKLYPSTKYNPLRQRQTLRFYLADVEWVQTHPKEARAAIERYNAEMVIAQKTKETGDPSAA